jgi:hypothetical protein
MGQERYDKGGVASHTESESKRRLQQLASRYRKNFENLERDLEREEKESIKSVHVLDFSEIFTYLHFDTQPKRTQRLNEFLFETPTDDFFTIFPATVYEFLWYLYKMSEKVKRYQEFKPIFRT